MSDDDVTMEFEDDDPTPLAREGALYQCWACPCVATPLAPHIGPPRCEAEAREHYKACAKGTAHAVCAATFQLKLGDFVWYFGPERRKAPRRP